MSNKNIVILKNDAVGDLVHSIKAINNLVHDQNIKKITIFLSNISYKFNFFFKNSKITVKTLNYNMNIVEKIKLFFFILSNKIDKIYILAPKNFYYFLPLFFFRIKFYAICVNNINNYKRPKSFLRKLLYNYVVNDRAAIFKRKSSSEIQNLLTQNNESTATSTVETKISSFLKKNLPKNYFYFHAKGKILKELGWSINEINLFFNNLLNYCDNLVFTKDLGLDQNTEIFKNNFSSLDFETSKLVYKTKNIIFFDNIDGMDLYNVIKYSKKTIAFHGMMTNLASIEKKSVLDLFYCKINSWDDYRNYRNSFYEFKPNYKGYDFIIPSKNIKKTLKKMEFSIKK